MECLLRWLDELDAGLLALRFAARRRRALLTGLSCLAAAALILLLR